MSHATRDEKRAVTGSASARHAVAIVGAGFGGIGLAIRLKQAGIDDFVLLEKSAGVGGTWRDNAYPGCACDIPAQLYSFSFATDFLWSRRYPTQPEIRRYLEHCVDRFGIKPHLRLDTALRSARFDADDAGWVLRTDRGEIRARVLVLGLGALHRPFIPSFYGQAAFQGPQFHSARWDHGVSLTGRRIAVIGTGASAIQLVPPLAAAGARLSLFQRTPSWILGKRDPVARPVWRGPLLRRAVRAWEYASHEAQAIGFVLAPRLMTAVERRARSFAKRVVPDAALRDRLTPDYRIGCKRILLSNDFLPTLNLPHVSLVSQRITRFVSDALVTEDGARHPADIVVYATGFQATDPLGEVDIIGRGGVTLRDHWRDGMRAWLGVAMPGFPNLFLLGGPNTGLGHNSVVFMLEAQSGHILRCLRDMRTRGAATVEIGDEPERRFLAWVDRRMRRTVWLSGCRSWYLDRSGRNTTLWPSFTFLYWLRAKFSSLRAYTWR